MHNLQVIEKDGIRVLTSRQLAEEYGTTADTIKVNFTRNRERFIEGKHYISLSGNDLKLFKDKVTECNLVGKTAKKLYLWTEKGALLHAKSLNTDKAWEVYDHLVDFYFRAKEEKPETAQGQQAAEKKAVIPVNTRTEKMPEASEAKTRTIPMYGLNPAKGLVVDIPKNKEALELIGEMRKYLTGMDALLDTYCMYLKEDEFKKIAYAVQKMSAKIERTALFLYTFKPNVVEEYM